MKFQYSPRMMIIASAKKETLKYAVYSAEFSKKCELEALWGIYDADCLKMLLPLYSQGINGETCTSLESDGDDDEEDEKDDNDENNEDSEEEEEDSVKSRRKSRKGYQT